MRSVTSTSMPAAVDSIIGSFRNRSFQMALFLLYGLLFCSMPIAEAASSKVLLYEARQGNIESMRKLGKRLYDGLALRRDLSSAVGWWKKAADKGDARSMVYLGDLYRKGEYFAENKAKAIELYRQAANKGDTLAEKRLAKFAPAKPAAPATPEKVETKPSSPDTPSPKRIVTTHVVPPVIRPSTSPRQHLTKSERQNQQPTSQQTSNIPSSDVVTHQIADQIAKRAKAAGISSIAVVSFLSNGGECDEQTKLVRGQLLESLVRYEVECYDREDCIAVATESGFSMKGEKMTSSQAILVGEIFSDGEAAIGYISYRVFRATDTHIIDAGFYTVKWDSYMLDNDIAQCTENLPHIDKIEMERIVSSLRRLSSKGVAIGQNGDFSDDNTLHKRIAYAQLIPALLQGNVKLFEREFFLLAAKETALSGQLAMPGKAQAIGQLKNTISKRGINKYRLQVSSIPEGRLLHTVNFSQRISPNTSAAPSAAPIHNGANDFADIIKEIEKENKDVKLVYEYAVIISDDYIVPKDFRGYKLYLGTGDCGWANDRSVPARSNLKKFLTELFRNHPEDKKRIAQELSKGVMGGFVDNNKVYLGPLAMCFDAAQKNLMYTRNGYTSPLPNYDAWDLNMWSKWMESPLSGTISIDELSFKYSTSIEWKEGLPWKAWARIDFTPSKSIIVKHKDRP